MKPRIVRAIIHILLLIISMFYGMLSYRNNLPPYNWLQQLSKKQSTSEATFPDYYLDTDVDDLIKIRKAADIDAVRSQLVQFLWGNGMQPDDLPSRIEKDIQDDRYRDISSLDKIDRISIHMEFDLESQVYYFQPEKPNNKVVLYHQGHEGDFYHGKRYISRFLENGYAVLAFSMPLMEPNNTPVLNLPHLGRLKIAWHDQMKFLSPPQGHPIKYFIEPVVISLNYLEQIKNHNPIAMIGFSGGGWTTTLAAAVDPRIQLSFPVAGSYPIYLRSDEPRDWGDWEQTEPQLYSAVNYLELYILGAYGEGRKQLQIINQFDACCFAGTKWQTYRDAVSQRVFALGAGEYDLFLDDTHQEHKISDTAMDKILLELQQSR